MVVQLQEGAIQEERVRKAGSWFEQRFDSLEWHHLHDSAA